MPGRRLVVRCDGDGTVGAGHVARCLPVASALAAHGWLPVFAGAYEGLAAWLLARARMPTVAADELDGDAAIVDSYDMEPEAICALAARMPVATLAEARRCPGAGHWIDYHADRIGDAGAGRTLLGPRFAPVDPAFAAAGRPARAVRTALITVGGSVAAHAVVPTLADELRTRFPGVRLLIASGAAAGVGDEPLAFPGTLLDVVDRIDLAVTAAGLTAYELAAAGVPMHLLQVADNQARVVKGLRAAGVAAPDLASLEDPECRAAVSRRGRTVVDGRGAARIAATLDRAWK